MAIKTRQSRDTYRSNVKMRPLRQNGLEAQYQGLDVKEVNVDHSGLPMLARGGFGNLRNFEKVSKEYIVDVDEDEHYPKAALIFLYPQTFSIPSGVNINQLDAKTFTLIDSSGTSKTFQFTTNSSVANGAIIPNTTDHAVSIANNDFNKRALLQNTTGSIESVFGIETFEFQIFSSGQNEIINDQEIPVTQDKIYIKMLSGIVGSGALSENTGGVFFNSSQDTFADQSENHEWRLNGARKRQVSRTVFYEDLRMDTIQSVIPHSRRRSGSLFRQPQKTNQTISSFTANNQNGFIFNMDAAVSSSIDPTTLARYSTVVSDEILIKQTPKRQELFATFKDDFEWREDPHYLSWGPTDYSWEGTWTNMSNQAAAYSSSLESHISAMLDTNLVSEQYIDSNPLSGRVDVFGRLSRIFDVHNELIFDRHSNSVFDQYLDPLDDFQNLQYNRFPKEDIITADLAFEDVKGKRLEPNFLDDVSSYAWDVDNPVMFNDYFDQPEQLVHDYKEVERFTRIDDDILSVLTKMDGRSYHIDRREWQESDYVYTATGFINSQVTGQDGIIYRELKR